MGLRKREVKCHPMVPTAWPLNMASTHCRNSPTMHHMCNSFLTCVSEHNSWVVIDLLLHSSCFVGCWSSGPPLPLTPSGRLKATSETPSGSSGTSRPAGRGPQPHPGTAQSALSPVGEIWPGRRLCGCPPGRRGCSDPGNLWPDKVIKEKS